MYIFIKFHFKIVLFIIKIISFPFLFVCVCFFCVINERSVSIDRFSEFVLICIKLCFRSLGANEDRFKIVLTRATNCAAPNKNRLLTLLKLYFFFKEDLSFSLHN